MHDAEGLAIESSGRRRIVEQHHIAALRVQWFDPGPTKRLWEVAHQTRDLRAVFLEACFPNSLTRLAKVSLHMTPENVLPRGG